MSNWTSFSYDNDGNFESSEPQSSGDLTDATIKWHADKLTRVSGTLQLPLKVKLEGERSHLSYEIYNESTAAYTLYYIFDDVVAATLIMPGKDNEGEASLMSLFRYLLLEEDSEVEATDERINELLASERFDFEAHEVRRPAAFVITLAIPPGREDQMPAVAQLDRELTAAFLSTEPSGP